MSPHLQKGYIQVYTGDGKGKTTAALGLALRAVGRGLTVYMVQFLKSQESGELLAAPRLAPYFKIFRFEQKRNFFRLLSAEEQQAVKRETEAALDFVTEVLRRAECDILILDEILGAYANGLVSMDKLLSLTALKPEGMELVFTGRDAPPELLAIADLVSEVREVKHYYRAGVASRDGIEK